MRLYWMRQRVEAARSGVHPFSGSWRAWLVLGSYCLMPLGFILMTKASRVIAPLEVAFAGVVGFLALMHVIRAAAARWGAEQVAPVIVSEGLCAACGYNLHGSKPEPDGCIVCPECGAAWSASRVRRSAPFVAGAAGIDAAQVLELHSDGRIVADARSHKVLVHSFSLTKVPRINQLTQAQRQRLERIRRAEGIPRYKDAMFVAGFSTFFVGAGAGAKLSGIYTTVTVRSAWLGAGVAMFGVSAGAVLIYRARLRRPADPVGAMLRERMCPGCRSLLDGVAPATDGFVECPTCLAAWDFNPVEPATSQTDPAPGAASSGNVHEEKA